MFSGFRKFIFRGNVVDLAVAVVIGAAFASIIAAFVKDLLTPLIAAAFGKPDFSQFSFTVNGAVFLYGDFVNAVINFLLVAAAIYFFVIAPLNKWNELRNRGVAPADPTTKKCPECLSEIPVAAKRCAHCTTPVAVGALA